MEWYEYFLYDDDHDDDDHDDNDDHDENEWELCDLYMQNLSILFICTCSHCSCSAMHLTVNTHQTFWCVSQSEPERANSIDQHASSQSCPQTN